ncbi:restriction endonuclease subunit S [Lactobacillus gallinarum]|uniref:restriction endonuclease subunit S n=1 Tax=Lactobacillus gallinarum TaxID=52242 RepID=UPI0024BA4DC5|nr:restriction endonuclease subunit S [Lactobacillus gallinarum]
MSNKEERKAPVLRFKGFTDDWEQKELIDVLKQHITDGPHETPKIMKEGIPFISVEAIVNNKIDFKRKRGYISNEYNEKCNQKYKPQKNDVYLVKSGSTVGKTAIVETNIPFNIWSPLAALRPNNATSPYFLFYLLQTDNLQSQVINKSKGGTQPNLSMRLLEHFKIFVPNNIDYQTQIARLLINVDKIISLQQRKLDILRQLKKTYLSEMYCIKKLQNPKLRFLGFSTNWKKYQIKQLGKVITGSTPSTKHSEYYNNKDGIPWVTPTDIHQNITYSSARKISKKGQKIARIVPQNTILVTCIASIGKNTILGQMGSFNQQINGLIPDFKKYDLYFLFTQTEFWSLKMKQLASAGTMQIVNKKEFENIETFIPNLNEQQKIGSLFLQLDNCVSDTQKKITSFKQIKNFLLQNMFI